MTKGRPRSDNPRAHAVQCALTADEMVALDNLRTFMSDGDPLSISEALRTCIRSCHTAITLLCEQMTRSDPPHHGESGDASA